ncbi:glycosyltransferase family 4 protein [Ammoniphilus sp. YIM 78166]|uniref:glycosyltransferase family 4 protein n=1 Tax=Ammoniphilus sp. YIM 78166 TaxID=1644106 RepID=UPI001F0DE778|nr:glycosyltransferase family 4 protein [Ammoniphilus sp. YIM 78166]
MKLAFIFDRKLPSPAIRGGAIQVLIDGIVPYLKKHHKITIFSITDPELPEKEMRNGIKYIRIPPGNYFREVARVLAKKEFDLIHVLNRPDQLTYLKGFAPKSKFVLSLHNERLSKSSISAKHGNEVIRSAKKIITISRFLKKSVVKRFPGAKKKLVTVYSGVDLSRFTPIWSADAIKIRNQVREKYGIGPEKKVILFVGRLIKKKGPHVLIEAMKHVIEKHPDAVLVISGGKYYSDNRTTGYIESLHALAKPIEEHIRFTQFIPSDEIPHHYLIADIFACSSQWREPAGRIHYEAMAAGIPIVTTRRGGIPEIVKHMENGWVINDFKNPVAFAEAINHMFDFPEEAKQMARNGRKQVEQNFQFSEVAQNLELVYCKAANIQQGGRRDGTSTSL